MVLKVMVLPIQAKAISSRGYECACDTNSCSNKLMTLPSAHKNIGKRFAFSKKHYTKPERILGRLLQEHHIKFKAKVKIANREVDFLIGKVAIEIDGHKQDGNKNAQLVELGYIPIHFLNKEIYQGRERVIKLIKNLNGNN